MTVDTDTVYSPIFGTNGNDTLTGTNRSEVFSGRQGDDTVQANYGSDLIYGGGGDDVLNGNAGNDIIYGGGGPVYADLKDFTVAEAYTANITFIDEGAGYRNALGMYKIDGEGNVYDTQVIFSNSSKVGSGGSLIPGESTVGVDVDSGDRVGFFVLSNAFGKGTDNQALLQDTEATFELRNTDGAVGNIETDSELHLYHIDGDTGIETIVKTQYGYDIYHSIADSSDNYTPNPDNYPHVVGKLNSVTGTIMLGFEDLRNGGDNDYDDVVFRLDIGTTNATALIPVSQPAQPSSEDDIISGGTGDDEAYGMAGDDIISGGDGADSLWGNSGEDILYGDAGADTLRGGKGNDIIHDGSGDDIVRGDSGDDLLVAGTGRDEYIGGSGFDTLDLSAADRFVNVNLHNHTVDGLGPDTVSGIEAAIGTDYDDFFKGDKRDNRFEGGDGDDWFRGLAGEDVFVGGEGSDTYYWRSKDLVNNEGEHRGLDQILDFTDGDTLDFSSLFGNGDPDDLMDWLSATETSEGTTISANLGGNAGVVAVVSLVNVFDVDLDLLVDSSDIIV